MRSWGRRHVPVDHWTPPAPRRHPPRAWTTSSTGRGAAVPSAGRKGLPRQQIAVYWPLFFLHFA